MLEPRPPQAEPSPIDRALDALFARRPTPRIAAVSVEGLVVPMPAPVPVPADWVNDGRASVLQMALPDDVPLVIEAWERVLREGTAEFSIRLQADPDHAVTVHFVDARARYGVLLRFITGSRDAAQAAASNGPAPHTRFAKIEKDRVAIVSRIEPAFSEMLGWRADDIVGKRSLLFIHPDDRSRAITNWIDCMSANPGEGRRVRYRHEHRNGDWVWLETTTTSFLTDPDRRCVVTEMIDISDEVVAQEALRANEQLLRRLTEALPIGIVQVDRDCKIVYRNERLGELIGSDAATSFDADLWELADDDRETMRDALSEVLDRGRDVDLEATFRRERAGDVRCALNMRALTTSKALVTGAIISLADVTERTRLREELERRATHDALTGCRNRASILEHLGLALAASDAGRGGTAVLFIDLDDFKTVNDRTGHAAGDDLLKRTSRCLMAAGRGGDMVGRLGGDEFLMVCRDVPSEAIAFQIAQRVAASLGALAPDIDGSQSVASVGVTWSNTSQDADALVAAADAAMYRSKSDGRGKPVLFVPDARA